MPTLGRKLRLFVERTWSIFLVTDITHLRFTRSHELADPPKRQAIRATISAVVRAASARRPRGAGCR
ncbi:MAG TPA: hypothetical protein VG425_05785 [Casimicrobiaceae bacterium]|jgi:NADH dehydrogenase|nr:hypothetical protein [Casimicrobiaceae bacterium]